MYEVWNLGKQPPQLEARFAKLVDAARFAMERRVHGPHDIREPDGSWHGRSQTLRVVTDPRRD